MKYLRINVTRYAKSEHENNKILLRDLKDLKKHKDILGLWVRKPTVIKILIFLKLVYRLSEISTKIPAGFSIEAES
jgi:hypothetical protein